MLRSMLANVRAVSALFTRGLQLDFRRWPMHLLRFALVGVFLFFLFLAWLQSRESSGLAPGLQFFMLTCFTNFVFITLAGTSFFTSAITEEKEEQTLGLLKMAGISPAGILLGKLGPRLVNAFLLLIIQYPFVQLAITLGGILPHQVEAAYVTLGGYMMLLACLGLLCSVIAKRTRVAASMMALAILVPSIAHALLAGLSVSSSTSATIVSFRDLVAWVSAGSVAYRLFEITVVGFYEPHPFSDQFLLNVAAAAVCFMLAWTIFERCTRTPHTEGPGGVIRLQFRGALRVSTLVKALALVLPAVTVVLLIYRNVRPRFGGMGFRKTLPEMELAIAPAAAIALLFPLCVVAVVKTSSRPRGGEIGVCWPNWLALSWQQLHFIAGGVPGLVTRVLLYCLVTIGAAVLMQWERGFAWNPYGLNDWKWSNFGYIMLWIGVVAGVMEFASTLSRGFNAEVKWQTLSHLMILPRSAHSVLWSRVVGSLIAMAPVAVFTLIGFGLAFPDILKQIDRLPPGNAEDVFYAMLWVLMIVSLVSLFVVLSVYLALIGRWGYLGTALLCVYFGTLLVFGGLAMTIDLLVPSRSLARTLIQWVPMIACTGLATPLIPLFYSLTIRKMRDVGAQS